MAHTPGPWRFSRDGGEPYWNVDMPRQDGSPGYGSCNAMVYTTADDARLIAAAPELLACLHSLRVVFASLEGWRDMDATLVDQFISSDGLHRVDAAIAKATGEESE